MKTLAYRFLFILILSLSQAFYGLLTVPAYALYSLQNDYPDNILENGDFTSGELSPWWLYLYTDDGANANVVVEDGWCRITDISLSGEQVDWYIQLIQTFTSEQIDRLQSGQTYLLTFDVISENSSRPCYVYFGLDGDPWTAYVAENIVISDRPATFRLEFTVNSVFPAIKLAFNLGEDESEVAFDNIMLEQKPAEKLASQQVIASSGMFFENGSGSIAFTLGELVIATLTKEDKILTQGFHQGEIAVIPDFTLPNLDFEITVFPNPVYDRVTLMSERYDGLFYSLYTLQGDIIQQGYLTSDHTEIDFTLLKPSIYLLKVTEGNTIKTFKIIKK